MTPSSLLLRAAAPIQSWGGHAISYQKRPTELRPTLSGVRGLLAGAMGWRRGQWETWLEEVEVWLRVEAPGRDLTDYRTINAAPAELRDRLNRQTALETATKYRDLRSPVARADGQRLMETSLYRESSIQDAEYLLAISHPDAEKVTALATAVREPMFLTYLGRRPNAPTAPFMLGVHEQAPVDLLDQIPTVLHPQWRDLDAPTASRPVYRVTGDRYPQHHMATVPARTRKEQLAWLS